VKKIKFNLSRVD